MPDIKTIADKADVIINGYAFRTPGQVRVSPTNTNLTNLTNRGKGQMWKHLPFAVYMIFVKKGVEIMWVWRLFCIFATETMSSEMDVSIVKLQ